MKISQRAARRLKARVQALEDLHSAQRNHWSLDYPGGVCLGSVQRDNDWLAGRIQAARMLKHAIVVTEDAGKLTFYALL